MKYMTIVVRLSADERAYLDRCADIRQCTLAGLAAALLRQIAHDQMVLAVLDDDGRPLRHPGGRKARAKSTPSPVPPSGSVIPPAELRPPAQHSASTERA